MRNKLLVSLAVLALAVVGTGCSNADSTNSNANANVVASDTTRPGPDGSEITTSVDATGVKTETRVFHNNPRVSKVVVTTRNGQRTTTVYSRKGDSKELKDDVGDVLAATGNTLADAAGFVADKAEDVAGETKEGVKTIGEKTGEAAKTVGEKTAEGAKKAGSKIKKAVTP